MKSGHHTRSLHAILIVSTFSMLILIPDCDILDSSPTVYINPINPDQFDATVYWDGRDVGRLIDRDDEIVIENVSKGSHTIRCFIYNVSQWDDFWDEETVNVKDNAYIKVSHAGIIY